jgi:hypothetical protein
MGGWQGVGIMRGKGAWSGRELEIMFGGHQTSLPAPTPAVFCPLLPKISPHADEVQRYALHWATRHGLLERPRAQAAFAGAKFANLMARAHPAAGPADLGLATAWLTAIFALDDLLETGLVADPKRMLGGVEALLAWLRAPDAPASPTVRDVLGRPISVALTDVWRRTAPRISPAWHERFVEHIREYLNGTIWESGNRAKGRLPTVAEYVRMRRHSAATEMFFDLIEPMHGIELPDAVLRDPDYLAARHTAGTAIGLFNDLISWRKEVAVGDLHNIVFIVREERQLSLADAVHAAVAEHDAQVAAFVAACDGIEQGPWGADPMVVTGVADLAHWLRGNLDWSLESGRYAAEPVIPKQR